MFSFNVGTFVRGTSRHAWQDHATTDAACAGVCVSLKLQGAVPLKTKSGDRQAIRVRLTIVSEVAASARCRFGDDD